MTIQELNYKLTGIENPRYLTNDQKMVIEDCLIITNEIEQSHKHIVMQAQWSDGAKGAAVGQRSVGTGVSGGLERCDGGCCDNGTGYCMFCENRL